MSSPIPMREFTLDLPEKSTGGISVCLIGSTRSGKTTLTKYLLRTIFKSHLSVLMSPSIHANTYDDISAKVVKAPEFYPEIIKEMYSINRKTSNHYQFLTVLDDVVVGKYNKELLKLFTIYRNSGVSGIMSIQSPILLNSAMRGNLNIVMMGYMNSEESVERTVRMFCLASMPGKNIYEKIQSYKALTADHHFLVLNNLTGELYRTKLHL